MKKMCQILSQRGFISVFALLVMLLLLALGISLLTVSSSSVKSASTAFDGTAAQYIAEAGAKRALLEVQTTNISTKTSSASMGGGTYEYEISTEGLYKIITCTGKYNNAQRKVVLSVYLDSPYQFAAFAGNNLIVGWATINGSVGSNHDVSIGRNFFFGLVPFDGIINGNVSCGEGANDEITLVTSGSKITGRTEKHTYTIPGFSRETYQADSVTPVTTRYWGLLGLLTGYRYYWNSPQNLQEKKYFFNQSEPLVINGDSGAITGPGIIYSTQDININWGANIAENVIIISEGDINVYFGASVKKTVLVASHDINILVADFSGSAVAGHNLYIGGMSSGEGSTTFSADWSVLHNSFIPQTWNANTFIVDYWGNKKLEK